MDNSVILFSPGIDSFLVKEYMNFRGYTPKLVYYDLKSKYSKVERDFLNKHWKDQVLYDESFNFKDIEHDDAYLPNRNLYLALHACSKYAPNVLIGGTASDRVSDNNEDIMNNLTMIARQSLNQMVTITSPFWKNYKSILANNYVTFWGSLNATMDSDFYEKESTKRLNNLIYKTFSCYNPTEKRQIHAITFLKEDDVEITYDSRECLMCPACFRKCITLNRAGAFIMFNNDEIVNKYRNEFQTSVDMTQRAQSTLNYIYRRDEYKKI